MPPASWFLADGDPVWALTAFFTLYGWHCAGVGVIIVGWQDLIAKIIPADRRGRFFGLTNFVGNGTGMLGALTIWLLAGTALANLAFGYLADHFGHRRVLEGGLILNVLSLGLAWLWPEPSRPWWAAFWWA